MFGSQFYNQQTSWQEIKSVLEVMEAGRWTSVYTYDHFVPPWTRTADVAQSDLLPTLEGWAMLAGMAAVTSKLELGVLVSGNTYRHPALVAKMAATIDEISGGRCILGIGAGWNVREHEAYGWTYPSMRERQDRLEEACELIQLLFTAERFVDFNGQYYTLKQAPFAPKGVKRKIPLMVGGTGPKRTLRTLAKYGDIMNAICGPEDLKRHWNIVEKHCEDVGRDPSEIQTLRACAHAHRAGRERGRAHSPRQPVDDDRAGELRYRPLCRLHRRRRGRVLSAIHPAKAGSLRRTQRGDIQRVRLACRWQRQQRLFGRKQ